MTSASSPKSGSEEEFELPVIVSDGEPEISEDEEEVENRKVIKRKESSSSPLVIVDPDLAMLYAKLSDNAESEEEEESEEVDSPLEQEQTESSDTEEEIDPEDLEEMQRRRRESEEENAGQELLSSLDDVNTDEEMEDNNSVHESKQDEVYIPFVEVWEYEPEEEELGKVKNRKRLPKDSEDSEATEYETIKSGDEEHLKDNLENEKVLKPLLFKLPPGETFEPFEEIHYIDEYDNNFNAFFNTRFLSSASSFCESNFSDDSYDGPKFQLSQLKSASELGRKKLRKKRFTDIQFSTSLKNESIEKNLSTKKKNLETEKMEAIKQSFLQSQTPLSYEIDLHKYNNVRFPEHFNEKEKIVVKKKNNSNFSSNVGEKKQNKPRHLISRKKRNAVHRRLHVRDNTAEETDQSPDDDIPSYKANSTYIQARNKIIGTVLDSIVNQTFVAIDELEIAKERKRLPYFVKLLIQEICYKIINDAENKQKAEAVKFNMEVLLDNWELEIYRRKRSIINDRLDEVSEFIVTNEINNAISYLRYEDHVCARLVRDAFAESLDHLKMPKKKINQSLRYMFFEYDLPDYKYQKNGTYTSQGMRKRRERDKVLIDRQLKNRLLTVESKQEETQKIKKTLSRFNFMRNIVLNIIKGEEFSENILPYRSEKIPVFSIEEHDKSLASNFSSNQESFGEVGKVFNIDKCEDREPDKRASVNMNDYAEKFRRVRVRFKVLDVWQKENAKLKTIFRRKSWLFHKLTDAAEESSEEDTNLNAIYSDESKQEKTENFNELDIDDESDIIENKLELPPIEEEVKRALKTSVLPVTFNHVKSRLKHVLENPSLSKTVVYKEDRNDSAIGSDAPIKSAGKRRKVSNESGFLSSNDDNDSFLEPYATENEQNIYDIVKQIPTLDRDYYLNQWIIYGITKPREFPSAPLQNINKKPIRKFHLRRPVSAESEVSLGDIVPIDPVLYKNIQHQGRLNSAKSIQSEVSSMCFSGRSTSMSAVEQVISDSEENTENNPTETKETVVNNKIQFFKFEKSFEKKNEDESAAWDFYLKRKKDKRQLKQYEAILKGENVEGSEIYVDDKMLLLNEEKEEILKSFSKTLVTYMTNINDEKEAKLLRSSSSKDKKKFNDKESDLEKDKFNEKLNNGESDLEIDRPVTPWRPLRNRPITPDSVDSDEEVRKMKELYCGTMKCKNKTKDEEKEARVWRLAMERKRLGIAQSAWKKPPSKDHYEEALQANRELFLKLQISLKNIKAQKPVKPEKRTSIAETEGIWRTRIEKRKELNANEYFKQLNKRAKSTPTSSPSSNNQTLLLLPNISKTTSLISSAQGYKKTKNSPSVNTTNGKIPLKKGSKTLR